MATFLLRVRGGLDPQDSQAPVFVDLERETLEVDDSFPREEENCRFRSSDGHPLEVPEHLRFVCVEMLQSEYYGTMYVVERE